MAGLIYLLDSNIISEPTKKAPNENVVALLEEHAGAMAISSVTWHELHFGIERMPQGRRRDLFEYYVSHLVEPDIPILDYDKAAAHWFAQERARLVLSGDTPSYADGQIASIAATQNLIVVTRNVGDFVDFDDIQIENWFDVDRAHPTSTRAIRQTISSHFVVFCDLEGNTSPPPRGA